MKHIQIFEDYSDEEINDLMGDLGGVGLQKMVRITCRLEFPKLVFYSVDLHPSWWTEQDYIFAMVEVVDRGSDNLNSESALNQIKRGEFEQVPSSMSPQNRWMTEPLSKENIQKMSQEFDELVGLTGQVEFDMVNRIFENWKKNKENKEIGWGPSNSWWSSPGGAKSTIREVVRSGIEIKVIN
jgi:hypothetical protein